MGDGRREKRDGRWERGGTVLWEREQTLSHATAENDLAPFRVPDGLGRHHSTPLLSTAWNGMPRILPTVGEFGSKPVRASRQTVPYGMLVWHFGKGIGDGVN